MITYLDQEFYAPRWNYEKAKYSMELHEKYGNYRVTVLDVAKMWAVWELLRGSGIVLVDVSAKHDEARRCRVLLMSEILQNYQLLMDFF